MFSRDCLRGIRSIPHNEPCAGIMKFMSGWPIVQVPSLHLAVSQADQTGKLVTFSLLSSISLPCHFVFAELAVCERKMIRGTSREKKQLIWYLKVWFNLASYLGFAMKWKNFTHQLCCTFFNIWVFIMLDCKIVIILNLQNKIPAECTIFFSTRQVKWLIRTLMFEV